MLVRAFPKLIFVIGPLLVLWYVLVAYFDGVSRVTSWTQSKIEHEDKIPSKTKPGLLPEEPKAATLPLPEFNSAPTDATIAEASFSAQEPLPLPAVPGAIEIDADDNTAPSTHHKIVSLSTPDGRYFSIDFGPGFPSLNPNIIPHTHQPDIFIIIAQHERHLSQDGLFEEYVCNASFQPDGTLSCLTPPSILPIPPTLGRNCFGDIQHFNLAKGPHDMRVSYGPDAPYVVYGSQSDYTCFGLFTQDLRTVIPDEYPLEALTVSQFKTSTELQRPAPWHEIEKNWFLFWSTSGAVYVHHDIAPRRVFAQLLPDGSVGPDLGPLAAYSDAKCMQAHMPKLLTEFESLHQATNSLSVTLCKREEVGCIPTDDNTFILTIFQHKSYEAFKPIYDPYVLLFRQSPPFTIHAIATKPLWIHGRKKNVVNEEDGIERGQMLYVTSLSWGDKGMRYHGFIDDVLFMNFGIEDRRSGGVNVKAGDLLGNLRVCREGV